METMNIETLCMNLIAYSGEAKTNFVEAMEAHFTGKKDVSMDLYQKGKDNLYKAHETHFELIQKEARNELHEISLLIVHSEDQLSSAEMFEILTGIIIKNVRRTI